MKNLMGSKGLVFLVVWAPAIAMAGWSFGEDQRKVDLDVGLYSGAGMSVDSDTRESDDYSLGVLRLYANAQITDRFSLELNVERDSEGETQLLDGAADFQFSPAVQVRLGKFQLPVDRFNLIGHYLWGSRPLPLESKHPNLVDSRDEGVVLWGVLSQKRLKYQVGTFQGKEEIPGGQSKPLMVGRLSYNFWDREPDYYSSATYVGFKDILAVSGSWMTKESAEGLDLGRFQGLNLEFLCEKNLDGGKMVTFESAFYNYERQGLNGSSDKEWFVLGGYMIHSLKGKIRSVLRYQESDDLEGIRRNTSAGVYYYPEILDMIVSAVYALDRSRHEDVNHFSLGVQVRL